MPPDVSVSYGGEAVFDGVMMKGATAWSVAVRLATGEIHTEVYPLPRWMTRARHIPLVRGVLALAASVVLGSKALHVSMRFRTPDAQPSTQKGRLATVIGVLVVLGAFLAVPALLAQVLPGHDQAWIFSTVEAFLRLAMIVGYIASLGLNTQVQEVFRYHSAEHQSISARESGQSLTPGEVATFPAAHPRCGTAFLLIIVITGIVIHALIGSHSMAVLVLSRVVALPVVAGVTYELLRLASNYSHSVFGRVLAAPGLALQRLTTRPSSEYHIEVAIAALNAVVEADERASTT